MGQSWSCRAGAGAAPIFTAPAPQHCWGLLSFSTLHSTVYSIPVSRIAPTNKQLSGTIAHDTLSWQSLSSGLEMTAISNTYLGNLGHGEIIQSLYDKLRKNSIAAPIYFFLRIWNMNANFADADPQNLPLEMSNDKFLSKFSE